MVLERQGAIQQTADVQLGSRFVMRSIFPAEDHGEELADKEFVLGFPDSPAEEETRRRRASNLRSANPDGADPSRLSQ